MVVKEEEINVILAFFVRPATRNKFPRPEGVEVSEYGVNDDVVRYSNSSAESFPSRHRRSSSRTISE